MPAHGNAARLSNFGVSARKFAPEVAPEWEISKHSHNPAASHIIDYIRKNGRSGGICTHDPYTPSIVRYQLPHNKHNQNTVKTTLYINTVEGPTNL